MAKEKFREKREGEKTADYRVAKEAWKREQEAKKQEGSKAAGDAKPTKLEGEKTSEYRERVDDWKSAPAPSSSSSSKPSKTTPSFEDTRSRNSSGPVAPGKNSNSNAGIAPINTIQSTIRGPVSSSYQGSKAAGDAKPVKQEGEKTSDYRDRVEDWREAPTRFAGEMTDDLIRGWKDDGSKADGDPKPVKREGEKTKDYRERVEDWREAVDDLSKANGDPRPVKQEGEKTRDYRERVQDWRGEETRFAGEKIKEPIDDVATSGGSSSGTASSGNGGSGKGDSTAPDSDPIDMSLYGDISLPGFSTKIYTSPRFDSPDYVPGETISANPSASGASKSSDETRFAGDAIASKGKGEPTPGAGSKITTKIDSNTGVEGNKLDNGSVIVNGGGTAIGGNNEFTNEFEKDFNGEVDFSNFEGSFINNGNINSDLSVNFNYGDMAEFYGDGDGGYDPAKSMIESYGNAWSAIAQNNNRAARGAGQFTGIFMNAMNNSGLLGTGEQEEEEKKNNKKQ